MSDRCNVPLNRPQYFQFHRTDRRLLLYHSMKVQIDLHSFPIDIDMVFAVRASDHQNTVLNDALDERAESLYLFVNV